MTKKHDLLRARFVANMKRVNGLTALIFSGIDQLKPTGFGQYEGVSADILRVVVVFLHVTFETFVRDQTHRKSWSFNSGADIDNAFRRSGIDTKSFRSLYPPLTQLARRRNRIVHNADFAKPTDTVTEKWDIADYWQLVMWNLAVVIFYHRLLAVTELATEADRKLHDGLEKAIRDHVAFGHQLIAFAKTPPELRLEALQKMSDILQTILTTLKSSHSD